MNYSVKIYEIEEKENDILSRKFGGNVEVSKLSTTLQQLPRQQSNYINAHD